MPERRPVYTYHTSTVANLIFDGSTTFYVLSYGSTPKPKDLNKFSQQALLETPPEAQTLYVGIPTMKMANFPRLVGIQNTFLGAHTKLSKLVSSLDRDRLLPTPTEKYDAQPEEKNRNK